jgi:hypothetical protein
VLVAHVTLNNGDTVRIGGGTVHEIAQEGGGCTPVVTFQAGPIPIGMGISKIRVIEHHRIDMGVKRGFEWEPAQTWYPPRRAGQDIIQLTVPQEWIQGSESEMKE